MCPHHILPVSTYKAKLQSQSNPSKTHCSKSLGYWVLSLKVWLRELSYPHVFLSWAIEWNSSLDKTGQFKSLASSHRTLRQGAHLLFISFPRMLSLYFLAKKLHVIFAFSLLCISPKCEAELATTRPTYSICMNDTILHWKNVPFSFHACRQILSHSVAKRVSSYWHQWATVVSNSYVILSVYSEFKNTYT